MPPRDPNQQEESPIAKLSGKAQQALGLPAGFAVYSASPFNGMNTAESPLAIDDAETTLTENFINIGKGNLRSVFDADIPLYTVPDGAHIIFMFFYTLGAANKVAVFLDDGSAWQVDTETTVQTPIGGPGLFYNATTGVKPACVMWGNKALLISNTNTPNDYWAWDGNLLYTAGGAAPNLQLGLPNGVVLTSGGAAYTSVPSVTTQGGTGTGIGLRPNIANGSVVSVDIVHPGSGYSPGDVVQLMFTDGGSDNSAYIQPILTATRIGSINVTNPGKGYTTATVNIAQQAGTGVAYIVVTVGGGGYQTYPVISFSGGGGTGASASAVANLIFPGGGQQPYYVLQGIVVVTPGTGYTSAPAVIIGGSVAFGSPAQAVAILGAQSGASATANIVNGEIASITLVSGGAGFQFAPLVTITGDGTGATAQALLKPTSVSSMQILVPGTGYTANTGQQTNFDLSQLGGSLTPLGVPLNGPTIIQPTLQLVGGGGFGAVGQVAVSGGAITGAAITNTGRNYTSPPAAVLTPGGNAAAAGFVSLMPFALSGDAMEVFNGQVWLANQAVGAGQDASIGNAQGQIEGTIAATAAGTIWNTAITQGAFLFQNTDSLLLHRYNGLRNNNGYLYAFGDSSISVFSNITATPNTSSGITTTNATYQNADPQIGLAYRDARTDFGRVMLLMNSLGVFSLLGASVQKISDKLDGLFGSFVPPEKGGLVPSAATTIIHNIRAYLLLMTFADPDTGANVNKMVCWDGQRWGVLSQSFNPNFIATQEVDSMVSAWGTDGISVRKMFQVPSPNLQKKIITKMYGGDDAILIKDMYAVWIEAADYSQGRDGISAEVSFIVSGTSPQDTNFPSDVSVTDAQPLIQQPDFPAVKGAWPVWGSGTQGLSFNAASAEIIFTSPDFALGNVFIGYTRQGAYA